jgi:predicted phosphate transport protein (TIGR00153 family)
MARPSLVTAAMLVDSLGRLSDTTGRMGLLPRDTSFFDHFEQQGAKTVAGCKAFLTLVDDPSNAAVHAKAIAVIEEECDAITHRVVESLHKTFITPIDRNDIYRLMTKMDDIMDFVEAAAERISLYDIRTSTKELGDLARVLVTSAERVLEAVSGLRNLKNPALILEKCVEINRLENEADALLRGTLAKLFREEKDAIAIIKWKEIYELLETATDRCEDVANIIEGVVLEHS